MSAFESAIDDSFDSIPQPSPDEEFTDDSFFDNAYQGPRDGHWEVTSSVGSFIDDRSPTVYGYHNKPYGTGHTTHIDEGLAKRLMQATLEDKRNAAIAAARSTPLADPLGDKTKRSSATSEVTLPKPFFVPPLRERPYNPVVPDSPELTDSAPTPPVAELMRSGRMLSGDSKASGSRGRPTPPPIAAEAGAASDRSDSLPSTGRTIKILGRNGEVAFVNLPSLPGTYPEAPSSVRNSATDRPAKSSETSLKHDKQSHSSFPNFGIDKKKKDMIPVTRTPVTEEQTPSPDGRWTAMPPASEPKQTHKSHSAIMSGALPASSPWKSPVPHSAAASCKESGVVMGGKSAVASNAGSGKIASSKLGSAISQGVFSTAQKITNMQSNSSRKSGSVQADPLPSTFDEVGMGVTTGFPAQKARSEQSNWVASYPGFGSERGSQRYAGSHAPSVKSIVEGSQHGSNYNPPNVRSTSRPSQPSYPGFGSEKASERSAGNEAPSARSANKHGQKETSRSNYKPPTVRSAGSSTNSGYPGFGFGRASPHSPGSHATSSRTSHDCKQDPANSSHKSLTVRSTSKPVHASYPGFGSERDPQRSVGNDAPSAKSTRHKQGEARSNYKSPTVHSPSSSSSISHAFGGFQHDSIVQQVDTHSARFEDSQSSTHSRQSQKEEDTGYASNSSRARVTPVNTRLARPEISLDTDCPVSPLSDGASPLCPSHSPVSPLGSHSEIHTEHQQTRFAGDGWISPHPLSVATSDIGAPPQSAVYISADGLGHRGTLTYSEWRAQRDAADSISGSFSGSQVPSALEPHIAPSAVYNYPPPDSFAGSYELQTRQLRQLRTQVDADIDREDRQEDWAPERHASRHTSFSQDQHRSYRDQRSVHSHRQSPGTGHDSSVHAGSIHQPPSVLAQDAGLNFPPQHDGTISDSAHHAPVTGYNVGLTPTELAKYHRQLSNTISHHSSRLSHAKEESKTSQPDYDVWNSGHTRASGRAASHNSAVSRQSARAFPPNLSYPREKTQIEMPWDQASSHASSSSGSSRRTHSQRQSSVQRGSRVTTLARETGNTVLPSHLSDNGSRVSTVSQTRSNVSQSQATYGTEGWQDLENAEDGHGRFQSRYDWRE